MGKHTPGPWYGPHFADETCSCQCGYIFSESQNGMGAICNVYNGRQNEENEPMDVAIANARLIAAAPCMLRALQLIERNTTKADWPDDIYEALTSSIAKATGDV